MTPSLIWLSARHSSAGQLELPLEQAWTGAWICGGLGWLIVVGPVTPMLSVPGAARLPSRG